MYEATDPVRSATQRDIAAFAERYQGLLAPMPDAIVVVNTGGAIVLFNEGAERLFGHPAPGILGQPVERLLPEAARQAHTRHRSQFLHQPQRRAMGAMRDLHGLHADGHLFPVEVSLSPLLLGHDTFVVSAIRDVSERKRYEAALLAASAAERASVAKSDFLSRISHELRTPLNAVLGFAQLLQLDPGDPLTPMQAAYVRHIERGGRHLLAMIDDLLDLSRIEAGQLAVSLQVLRVAEPADEVLALVATTARSAGVDLRPLHDPAQAFVRADRLRLRQVLLNLVSNAIKYNRRGGHVEVTVEPDGEQLAIVVADTGIGLSAQQQAQLFRPFSRVGAETTEVPGTGLGLSIARRLTELMGGTLEAASRPGEGSRFTLRLPAAAAPPGTPGQRGAPTLQADGGRAGPEVFELLLVEDNPVNAEVVIATVRQRPAWRLRHARSGAQAVALAQQRRPHLTLVDMHLGDMTGLDLMAAMDRHPATAGLPRVALSADALSEHIDAAVGAGFERYLVKPLDLQALLRCLDEWERRLATAAQAGANPA